jgi:hypothetical protein
MERCSRWVTFLLLALTLLAASVARPLSPSSSLPPPSPHPASTIAGVWTASPTCVPENESGACDTPLLGNGDLGAGVSSPNGSSTVRFHLGLNQFWSLNSTEQTPAQSQVRTVAVVAMTFPGQLTFDAQQWLYNGSLSLRLRDQTTQYHLVASIAPNTNLLLVAVTTTPPQAALQVNVTTSTIQPFPVRTGAGGYQYVTRDSFYPNNSFPITAAVVTRWLGDGIQATSQTTSPTSVTTALTVKAPQAASLTFAVVVTTNLDAAGMNQSSYDPPAPVVGVDPLPLALKTALSLTTASVQAAQAQTVEEWRSFWSSTCVVRLPDARWLERYYYGAQYIMHASTRTGKVAPGLWGPWVMSDNPNWEGDYTLKSTPPSTTRCCAHPSCHPRDTDVSSPLSPCDSYNYQSTFWGTFSSNQLDLASVSNVPMLQYLPQARLNARQLKNCTTPLCMHFPVHIAPWGRSSVGGPQGDWRQQFIATFSLMNLITQCEYTRRDGDCVLAYESMKGVTEWWRFYLIKEDLPGGGYRYVDPDESANCTSTSIHLCALPHT